MRLYGHRGAAGLALENSHDSILAGLSHNLDAVEFDVHKTADGRMVVIHDHHTGRVAPQKVSVHSLELGELQKIALHNGQQILSLDELLDVIGSKKQIIIDVKDPGCADELTRVFARHPECKIMLGSFKHDNIRRMRELRPDIPAYVLEHSRPFHVVHSARRLGARGLGLNKWLMNPLTYYLAKKYGLELAVYTVNSPRLIAFYKRFYPGVSLFTDHPERF